MKETEKILSREKYTIEKTIEIMGKVGEGEMVLGKLKLPIDSELSKEARNILREVLGH